MPVYNLIEYSGNFSDTSGSLWQFKRDKIGGADDLTADAQHIPNNLSSFRYKPRFIIRWKWCKNSCTIKILD